MSEPETPPISEPPPSNHYRIRKEVVALCVAAMVGWVVYQVHDWWTYMDWPPYTGSNQEFIKTLNCAPPYEFPIPSRSEIESWSIDVMPSYSIKQKWLKDPQCAAYVFFRYEGSGTRQIFDVIDAERKTRMARVEITFARDERSYK